MKLVELGTNIYSLEGFLTNDECDTFIQKTETAGYQPATIQTDAGPRLVDFVRNNNRVIVDDKVLAQSSWEKLKGFAPPRLGQSIAIGLNERFRFNKYQPGQQFKKHRDQSFIRNSNEASYYTFMVYLNEDYSGGETKFNNLVVTPKKGSALIFYHYLEHEGAEVLKGTKYVLRTDIMYRLNE